MPYREALQGRGKDELIALIEKMVERHPDLALLLELPTLSAVEEQQLDARRVERQVAQIFANSGYAWGASADIAAQLRDVVDLAQGATGTGAWENAALICEIVIDAILEHEDQIMHDDGGDLHWIISDCVNCLGECLDATQEPERRRALLKAIFRPFAWDVKSGGLGVAEDAPDLLLHHATPAERPLLAAWVREALSGLSDWGSQALGAFLLELQSDSLDDEAFLKICRETGRLDDLVERLLSLKRIDEAVAAARGASDYALLSLAERFARHGHGEQARALVRERLPKSNDIRLPQWLRESARSAGLLEEALEVAHKLFWMQPNVANYQELQAIGRGLNRWESLRQKLRDDLLRQEKHAILSDLYLSDGELDQAIKHMDAAIKQNPQHYWAQSWLGDALSLRVAQAAEQQRPKDSIRIYLGAAQRLIGQRSRGTYAEAAQHLRKVRQLYQDMGDMPGWERLLSGLRAEHRRLSALQDELRRAGL